MMPIRVPVGKFCLYDHSSNGQVFYVGIGSPTRPFEKIGRNELWIDFVSRLDEYFVTIHAWADSLDDLRKLEASMIKHVMPACNKRLNPKWSPPPQNRDAVTVVSNQELLKYFSLIASAPSWTKQ